MGSGFYKAFEDRHRGSRDLIKERLRVYLPFVEPLKRLYPGCRAIDLGCGRGEWLELLGETGIEACGVDIDADMAVECRKLGLNVEEGDAISFLRNLPDESQAVVSAIHVVEHLPFPEVQTLATEAMRVLRPAGLLILETPNPENLVVAGYHFYVDPTHMRPVPPQLLSFLTEYCGFCRTKVLRPREDPSLAVDRPLGVLDVLGGVSADYAVVAQKKAPEECLAPFNRAFGAAQGMNIESLAGRYDAQQNEKIRSIGGMLNEKIDGIREILNRQMASLQTERDVLQTTLQAVYNSTSWRITAPMRRAKTALMKVLPGIQRVSVKAVRLPSRLVLPVLTKTVRRAAANPLLVSIANKLLQRNPVLRAWLRRLVITKAPAHVVAETDTAAAATDLPRSAQRVFEELKAALGRAARHTGGR